MQKELTSKEAFSYRDSWKQNVQKNRSYMLTFATQVFSGRM
jgi:hypothetical protein